MQTARPTYPHAPKGVASGRARCRARDAGAKLDKAQARIRRRKVRTIRRLIQQERYDIDSRFMAILDRFLKDLAT